MKKTTTTMVTEPVADKNWSAKLKVQNIIGGK
jgi:hypothetical protein